MKGTEAAPIPAFRRQIINNDQELPDRYSQTPNGTLYSTTPGGTRIIYERNVLLNLKNSPLARTPPGHMAYIPGVTNIQPTAANDYLTKRLQPSQKNIKNNKDVKNNKTSRDDQPQFEMDI